MGTIPRIIAVAVISTGRTRAWPAASIASCAESSVSRSSLANVTIRMLLAVATPMHMMEPIKEGTLSVVPVRNSIHRMPAIAPGQRHQDDEGVQPGLEVHRHQQVHQHHREDHPQAQAEERRLHGLDLSAQIERRAARQMRLFLAHDLPHFRAHAAQVPPVHIGIHVEDRPHVVVVDDHGHVGTLHRDQVGEKLRAVRRGAGISVGLGRAVRRSADGVDARRRGARLRARRRAVHRRRSMRRSACAAGHPGNRCGIAASARRRCS